MTELELKRFDNGLAPDDVELSPIVIDKLGARVVSSYIDRADPERPQFTYQIELTGPGGSHIFTYSGGVQAFLDHDQIKRHTKVFLGGVNNNLSHFLNGRRFVDRKENEKCEDLLFKCSRPTLPGLLYCLALDAEGCKEKGFEEWAEDYGFDTDSRSAERTYHACIEQSRHFRKLMGGDRTLAAAILRDVDNY